MLGIADAGIAMPLHSAATTILIAKAFMKQVGYPRTSMVVSTALLVLLRATNADVVTQRDATVPVLLSSMRSCRQGARGGDENRHKVRNAKRSGCHSPRYDCAPIAA